MPKGNGIRYALGLTLGLRAMLGAVMAATWVVLKPYYQPTIRHIPPLFDDLPASTDALGKLTLDVWVRWDAVHHLNLAYGGYANAPVGNSVFYPLYAFVTRLVAVLTGGNIIAAGLIVSTFATVAALALLYDLAARAYGHTTARYAVLALALYPTAFFLLAPFTEALFLALTLGVFAAVARRRWGLAGLLGFLASLTRGPGVFTALALVPIAWRQWRAGAFRSRSVRRMAVVWGLTMPMAGAGAFLGWRAAEGYPPVADVLREESGLVMRDPVTGLVAAVRQWLEHPEFITTLETVTAFVFIGLMVALVWRPAWRKPEWVIYTGINLALFLSKESLVASSLQSIARYVLVLFPIYIVLGDFLARQSSRVRFAYFAVSGMLLLIFSMAYTAWVFVG